MSGNNKAKEAYICIDLAIQAMQIGKWELAKQLLCKAEKIYPTARAKGNK